MAVCRFCDAEFDNAQGVRAHLKACEIYQGSKTNPHPKAGVPKAGVSKLRSGGARSRGSGGGGFTRADHLEGEVAASEARLRLRQMEAAHREFDEEDRRLRDVNEGERIEAGARAQRRAVIQAIKAEIARRPVSYSVTSGMQAEALQAIEKDLAGLAVEELPRSELLQIAEAARDRVYQPAVEEQRETQEREERRSREFLERMGRIRRAVEYARTYLQREVSRSGLEDEVGYFKQSEIVKRSGEDLEREFECGNPSAAELKETVEDMVSEELDGWAGDDDEVEED